MKILHLSDFHIDNTKNNKLRPSYYDEFLKDLNAILKNQEITHLFITGDLINRGQVEALDHAKDVITLISNSIGIKSTEVFIVNGNHDVKRGSENFNDFYSAMNSFSSLRPNEGWFKTQLSNGNLFILTNSIKDNIETGMPFELNDEMIDEVMSNVKKTAGEEFQGDIFILSHQPAIVNNIHNHSPFDEGNTDWTKSHIWSSAASLKDRICKYYSSNRVFWFSGDVHQSETMINGKFHNLIGASITGSGSLNTRGTILDTTEITKSKSIIYTSETLNDRMQGTWDLEQLKIKSIIPLINQKNTDNTTNKSTNTDSPNQIKTINKPNFTLISDEFERELSKAVYTADAYKFGRFETNTKYSALAWVATNSLFNEDRIFNQIVQHSKYAIDDIELDKIFIGIGPWGGIIASRLASLTNSKYAVMAPSNREDSYEKCELFNENIRKIISNKDFAITISDVISTGETISWIENELETCGKTKGEIRHLTVFVGDQEKISSTVSSDIFFLCGSIKLPTINQNSLPPRHILRSNVFYHD